MSGLSTSTAKKPTGRVEFDDAVLKLDQQRFAVPTPRTFQPEKDPVVDHTVRSGGVKRGW